MKKYFLRTFFLLFSAALLAQNTKVSQTGNKPVPDLTPYFTNSHDLTSLPAWGSYSKRYAGISHIADVSSGVRFDFSVMPGYYRNRQLMPNVMFESSYYPWDAAPDASWYTYRYELEWKDRVVADVTYHVMDDSRVLVEINCINNSPTTQNLMLNNMAYIDYAEAYPEVKANTDNGLFWKNAVDYLSAESPNKFPRYNLVYDGLMRFELRNRNTMDGSLLGGGFGRYEGDCVVYEVDIPAGYDQGGIAFRYRANNGVQAVFEAEGLLSGQLQFNGTGEFEILRVPYNAPAGKHSLALKSTGAGSFELDGFYIGATSVIDSLSFVTRLRPYTPVMETTADGRDILLKYEDCANFYGIAWNYTPSVVREVISDDMETYFRDMVHNHVTTRLVGGGRQHYANAYLRPVVLQPFSEQKIYLLLCTGDKETVTTAVADFHLHPDNYVAAVANNRRDDFPVLPGGEQYRFGYRLMQACHIGNFTYPLYTQREYIRHFSPGKHWNSLYTWDLGFSAIGLVEIDPVKSFECIRQYTTEPDAQSAFIHHGTPMPIQFFAWKELWNATHSLPMLRFMYPRMKQYAEFMTGKHPTSTTRMKGTNLLRTWDYFYNSGGWDDYPPQTTRNHNNMTSVAVTSAYIRALKILRMAARELGLKKDIAGYDAEIKTLGDALLKYAWDPESGYFGWVVHDNNGDATGIFRYHDGTNYNKGLDGVYPLFAGITNGEQTETLIQHLFNPQEIWTHIGLSAVDQSAPYFKMDGYWNGAVWMPHQWNMWKALLDAGRGDLARQIAITGLNVWEKECEESYFTFEHFIIASGRGAGWHQFTGISSPVLSWFTAYYKLGKVTTGFEIWLSDEKMDSDFAGYKATLQFDDSAPPHERCMIVCLDPANDYKVTFDGKQMPMKIVEKGQLQITLPATNRKGELRIVKIPTLP